MEKLRELTDKFKTTTDQPVPLSWFDIPLQWIFAGIGFLGGAWILLNILRSTTKTYSWDADTKTLTLPGGKQVTTANLADVDKRKWHKFFCALQFNDGTAPVEIDLLKYANLEDWVLDLERTKFPERAVEAAAQATDQPATA